MQQGAVEAGPPPAAWPASGASARLEAALSASTAHSDASVPGPVAGPLESAASPSGRGPPSAAAVLAAAEAWLQARLADPGALAAEFAALPRRGAPDADGAGPSVSAALAAGRLNRYSDVLPYDHNRVRLRVCRRAPEDPQALAAALAAGRRSRDPSRRRSLAARRESAVSKLVAALAPRERSAPAAAAPASPRGEGDYINASRLGPGPGDVAWAYVAAQGPLPNTCAAFWRMAAQGRAAHVVMLSRFVEQGRVKCAPYLAEDPGEGLCFEGGVAALTLAAERPAPDVCRRTLLVCLRREGADEAEEDGGEGEEERGSRCEEHVGRDGQALDAFLSRLLDCAPGSRVALPPESVAALLRRLGRREAGPARDASSVLSAEGSPPPWSPPAPALVHASARFEARLLTHLHYTAWPDHGTPAAPDTLLWLCAQVPLDPRPGSGPAVVHCSAGIGRSGVFVVLSVLAARLERLARAAEEERGAQATPAGDARGPATLAPLVAGALDLAALVAQLRAQRMGMVQTREQYVFCYAALLSLVRAARKGGAAGSRALPEAQDGRA